MSEELTALVLSHVEYDTNGGCWLWAGSAVTSIAKDYGRGRLTVPGETRGQVAARVAYAAFRGDIPAGRIVCHKCDVPACVNPAHLFLGTYGDNNADARTKGRAKPPPHPRGEKHHMAAMSAERAAEILAATGSKRAIARRFGVSDWTVRSIKNGRRWSSVTGLPLMPRPPAVAPPTSQESNNG